MSDSILPWKMTGYRVLVEAVPVERFSKGGIVLAGKTGETQAAQDRVILRDVGPTAFEKERESGLDYPKVGDECLIAKYGGIRFQPEWANKDSDPWWHVLNDDDIYGVRPNE